MAKVVITLVDLEKDGQMTVETDFDPPVTDEEGKATAAQTAACVMLNALAQASQPGRVNGSDEIEAKS